MITVFEGYTRKSNKSIRIELDPDSGFLWVVYTASGHRRRYNEERYFTDSDFTFLLNDFRH